MRAAVIEALGQPLVVRSVDKPAQQFAFSYPLAAVRRQLWTNQTFALSRGDLDLQKSPDVIVDRLIDLACYAA